MKKEVINKLKTTAQEEIIKNTIVHDFYLLQAKKQDEETKAKTLLKAGQIKQTIDFNKDFNEYLETL